LAFAFGVARLDLRFVIGFPFRSEEAISASTIRGPGDVAGVRGVGRDRSTNARIEAAVQSIQSVDGNKIRSWKSLERIQKQSFEMRD
jgi:hypothetical protein